MPSPHPIPQRSIFTKSRLGGNGLRVAGCELKKWRDQMKNYKDLGSKANKFIQYVEKEWK
jgi:hypothetical protein